MQQIGVAVRMYTRLRKLPARYLDEVNDHDCSFRRSSFTLQANAEIIAVSSPATVCLIVASIHVPDFRLLTGYCNKINGQRSSSFRRVLSYYVPEFYNGDCLQENH